jgi:anaerobic magnesium-protoporphyrin IX monomethyl ester cyclase
MEITFIDNFLYGNGYIGIMYLSSYIKKYGHKSKLIYGNKKSIIKQIKEQKPRIVGLSCNYETYPYWKEVIDECKKNGALVILGGPLATIYPEILHEKNIDIICRGNGEEAIVDLLDFIEKSKDYTKIKNLWIKQDNKIYKNKIRRNTKSLDQYPFPDWELYDKKPFYLNMGMGRFIASRGCSFNCNYCHNHLMKRIIGKKYIKRRSVDNLIAEIQSLIKKEKIQFVSFFDDMFVSDIEWIDEFSRKYKKIGMRFSCNINASIVNESVIKKLKDCNCFVLRMGIETYNERIKRKILNRNEKNKTIIKAAGIIKKYGIKLHTYNIIGIPLEDNSDIFKTIELNHRIKSDFCEAASIMIFPKYDINKNIMQEKSKSKKLSGNESKKMLYLFEFATRNKFTYNVTKILINLPFTQIYKIFYLVYLRIRLMKTYETNYFRTLRDYIDMMIG